MRLVLAVVFGVVAALSAAIGQAPARLIGPDDLRYEGAFRLPAGASDQESFDYGGTALGWSVERGSLFLVGHDWFQRAAEITVPAAKRGAGVGALATATLRQPLTDVLGSRLREIGEGTVKIGGLLPWNGSLVISAYVYYDAAGVQRRSHFRSALDLARPDVQGPWLAGAAGPGVVAGYMALVPEEWQAPLGGPALTGQCCLSIISRTSLGPAVSVFSPSGLGTSTGADARPLLGYPLDHPALGTCESQGGSFNCTTSMAGVVFPAGTRSVLFFGRVGQGAYCYGTGGERGGDCVDPSETSKGPHAYPYAFHVWAYDVNDLIAVRNSRRARWDVRPYRTWTFDLPFAHPSRQLNGVAWDPATRRIFLSAARSDGARPLIHVFTVR